SNEIDMAPHLDGYGDSIGYNLENVADKGYLRFNVDGCGTGQLTTSWEKVIFDATFPAGSKIQVRARTAKKKIDLGLSEWSDPFVVSDVADLPVDLLGAPGPLDVGPFMQVEVELNRGTTDSPKLKGMSVEYSCNLIDD
ncbi:MAG: hypothetical protein KC416_12990, partial [Myxococcales bacterium]|nr:hypothetical protein [Myxococcales bacterium]